MPDQEIDAMAKVGAALAAVDDAQARVRVLRWANEKFGFTPSSGSQTMRTQSSVEVSVGKEMPGIAVITDSGDVRFTIRDPKAKSAREATTRLVYVGVHASQALTGKKGVSRKGVIVPLLKHWRVYDGNARQFLAMDKGLLKNGDELELDGHAQKDAEQYIQEIQDSNRVGSWRPGSSSRKKTAAKAAVDKH
jgi:hypothetical protein